MSKNLKRSRCIFIVFVVFFCYSCQDDPQTSLEIIEDYANPDWPKEGLVKGNIYASGFDQEPLFKDLVTDESRKIIINDILPGTYRFEYYVKPEGHTYWTVPRNSIIQIREGERKLFFVK